MEKQKVIDRKLRNLEHRKVSFCWGWMIVSPRLKSTGLKAGSPSCWKKNRQLDSTND